MSLNTLNLKQKQGGRVIKQADRSSTFKFALQDSNGALINLNGQTANISLHNPNNGRYWETTASVRNAEVEFKLPGNLTNDDYILEIACNGYVFPSDNDFVIEVVKGYKELTDKETAEVYKKSIEEITQDYIDQSDKKLKDNLNSIDNTKKRVDDSINKGLKDIKNSGDTYINNIKTTFDTAKTEFDKNASVKTGLIESTGNEYVVLIGTKKDQALKEIDGQVKTSTDKYLADYSKKLNDKVDKVNEEIMELNLLNGLTGSIKAKKDALGGVTVFGNVKISNADYIYKNASNWAVLPVGYRPDFFVGFSLNSMKTGVGVVVVQGMCCNERGEIYYKGIKSIGNELSDGFNCYFSFYFKAQGAW